MKRNLAFLLLFIHGFFYAQIPVSWENLKNVNDNKIQITKGNGTKGQATAKNMLYGSLGEDYYDGVLSFATGSIPNENKAIGFTVVETDEIGFEQIEYGFSFQSNKVKAYGKESFIEQNYTGNTNFKLERFQDRMRYLINDVLVYEEFVDKSEYLLVRAQLKSNNARFQDVTVSYHDTRPTIKSQIDYAHKTILLIPPDPSEDRIMIDYKFLWEDGDRNPGSAKFVEQTFPYTILLDHDKKLKRSISLGKIIQWTNLSGTAVTAGGIQKTNGNNWGTAKSSEILNSAESFWIENKINFQQEQKIFGMVPSTGNIQNPSSVVAGFSLSANYQLEILYNGSVIRTIEAYNDDIIRISREGGSIKWELNGQLIEERSLIISASTTYRIAVLLKNGTSFENLTYLKPVQLVTGEWDQATSSGKINFNLASLTNVPGPFHFLKGETPLPTFEEIYVHVKDALLADSLPFDSLLFYQSNLNTAVHSITGLEMGQHFYSVYNSSGQRILGGKTSIFPGIQFFDNTGFEITDNIRFRSTANNAYMESNIILGDELEEGKLVFEVKEKIARQVIGLVNLNSPKQIRHGFLIENRRVRIINNLIPGGPAVFIGKNALLSIEKTGHELRLKVNGRTQAVIILSPNDAFRHGSEFQVVGKEYLVKEMKASTVKYKLNNLSSLSSCETSDRSLAFSYTVPFINSLNHTFSYSVENILTNQLIASGNLNIFNSYILPDAPIGVYHITGTINTIPVTTVSEYITIGYGGQFDPVQNYDLAPTSNSLRKNTSNETVFAKAVSENKMMSSQNSGWVAFKPLFQLNGANHFSFSSTNNLVMPVNTVVGLSKINLVIPIYGTNLILYTFVVVDNNGIPVHFEFLNQVDKVFAKFASNQVSFKINDLPEVTISRPPGDLYFKVVSKKLSEGYRDVVFSYPCSLPPVPLHQIGYSELSRKPSSAYAIATEGKVKFTFDEEYQIDPVKKLSYKVYNDRHKLVASCSFGGNSSGNAPVVSYRFDDNRYILDIGDIDEIFPGEYFTIEVTTIKGDKRYLRVFYNN